MELQHQPFQALALLVERAGEVVTSQELAEVLWKDGIHVDFDQGSILRSRRSFTEGFDTPDLQEASTLLQELF